MCSKFCYAKHFDNKSNSDKKIDFLFLLYSISPTILGIQWFLYLSSIFLLKYYEKCVYEYIDFLESIKLYSMITFVLMIILIIFFIKNDLKNNRKKINEPISNGYLIQPIFYIGAISLSKILTNIDSLYFLFWIIPFILSVFFMYCFWSFFKLNSLNQYYLIILTFYTLLVVFWTDIQPYINIVIKIQDCITKDILLK